MARLRPLWLPLVAWLPLLLLTAVQGVAVDGRVRSPFLLDVAVHVRFWISVPLLLIAENVIDPWLGRVLRHFSDEGFVDGDDLPRLGAALARAQPSPSAVSIELALVAFTYASVFLAARLASPPESSWRTGSALAEGWYNAVSIPLFQFLVFRWLWWFGRWCMLLWRISRLRLRLMATHPDDLGGLGFIAVGHAPFALIVLAVSTVLSAEIGQRMRLAGLSLESYKGPILGFVVASALFVATPLLAFSGQLLDAKRRGLLAYGALAFDYAQSFQAKWIDGAGLKGAVALGNSDIQALSDLQNSYGTVRRMRVVMWNRQVLVPVVVAAALPMVPLVLSEVPLSQLARLLVKALG